MQHNHRVSKSLAWRFSNLLTAINSPVDQTTLLRFSTLMEGDAAPVNQAAFLVQDFLTQAADYLNECLDAGPLQAGIVQGSAFCGAISCTPEGVAEASAHLA